MLTTALGPSIAAMLDAPDTIEVIANPDGRLWLEQVGKGRIATPHRLEASETERVIRLVATLTGAEVNRDTPIVSAELPPRGERFEGVLPPVSRAPCFAIRKPAGRVFTLDDYQASGVITPEQAATLRAAVRDHANIMVAGGTGSGKTTLANALLHEIAPSASAWSFLKTRASSSARQRMWSRCARSPDRSRCRIWCDPRSGCGLTASWSARSAVLKPSTCSRPGTPDIPAASRRCMPTPRRRHCPGLNSSPWKSARHRPAALIAEAIDLIVFVERGGPAGRRIPEILAPKGLPLKRRTPSHPSPGREAQTRLSLPTGVNHETDKTLRALVRAATLGATAVLVSGAAHAATAGGGMPWEGPLTAVLDSITGPVARIVAILIIVATGLTLAFGDVGQGFKKLLQILFGLAIAFAAASFFLPLVGGGGAVIP
jgi:type IV secretory pathway VirB2 component (pilin)